MNDFVHYQDINLWLLAPEISLGLMAAILVIADLGLRRKSWLPYIALAGAAASFGWTLGLALADKRGSTFAEALVVDDFALFFKFLFAGVAAMTVLFSMDYVRRNARLTQYAGEYYALVLLASGGMMLMAGTGELVSIYIALELTSISLYVMATLLKDERSSEAGLKYLLLGAIASAVMLYGMALVYGLTGTTELSAIVDRLPAGRAYDNPALMLAMTFLVAGFGFKIAAVPFQMWVPDVYEGAPTPVTAFLSVASKGAGFAVVLRVFNSAFGAPADVLVDWRMLFAVLAAITMFVGNIVAIAQTNIKRMLGYSSIAQAGYLMVGIATVTSLGVSSVQFFLASYALTNLGAFIAVIAVSNRINSDQIADYAGMARRAPLLAQGQAFCLVSLTGIPPTAGFIAKIYLFSAAVGDKLTWLVVIAVINTVISAYYYLRVVKVMYTQAPPVEEHVESSPSLSLSLAFAAAGVLVLGIVPQPLLRLLEEVGSTIAGVTF